MFAAVLSTGLSVLSVVLSVLSVVLSVLPVLTRVALAWTSILPWTELTVLEVLAPVMRCKALMPQRLH